VHRPAEHVGKELEPPSVPGAAATHVNRRHRDARNSQSLQAMPEPKGDSLERGAEKMTTLVVEADTNPCCSHVRIEQRRPLAGDVWSETQATCAGRRAGVHYL
jgi:hypothetical protein